MNTKPTARTKLTKACEEAYATDSNDCNHFVRAVCSKLHIIIHQGDANSIAGFLREQWHELGTASIVDFLKTNWDELRGTADAKAHRAAAAKAAVAKGKFVVAALSSSDSKQVPKPKHGHVAVVVPGELDRGTYPKVYCGNLGSQRYASRGDKSVGQVFHKLDCDDVYYYQVPVSPTGLGDPA